jgi:uncharacterized protein (DUF3084 family)
MIPWEVVAVVLVLAGLIAAVADDAAASVREGAELAIVPLLVLLCVVAMLG